MNLLWTNAVEIYDDWGPTGWGWLVIAVILVSVIVWICKASGKASREEFAEQCKQIRLLGYKDIDDIQVFLKRIDASIDDFICSKGIRKQYELFADGKSSKFIETAESNKKASDAESAGQTSGLVTGLVIGSAMHSGR